MDLNQMASEVHEIHRQWWQDIITGRPINRNKGELLMLVATELSEATEGIRKNLMDDKLPHRKMEEVEMADAFIRLLDFAGGFRLHLFDHYETDDFPNDFILGGNKAEQLFFINREVVEIFDNVDGKPISCALHMINNYCQRHQLDLMGAMAEKLEYNKTRADHKHEARRLADGKKF